MQTKLVRAGKLVERLNLPATASTVLRWGKMKRIPMVEINQRVKLFDPVKVAEALGIRLNEGGADAQRN
jgi:hypothetical protein